jgi:hypothetical protein
VTSRRIALVPAPLGLLPEYAGLSDPLGDVRTAATEAVRWLLEEDPASVVVLAPPEGAGLRVAQALLSAAGSRAQIVSPQHLGDAPVLVVGDGSARRGEKAPGHIDDRARPYDAAIGASLESGDLRSLADLDVALGAELMAGGAPALQALGRLAADGRLGGTSPGVVDYAGDPFGVQYWVVRWTCAS